MKPSQLLSRTKVEQCLEDYNEAPGKFCALGAIAHEAGWTGYFRKDGKTRKKYKDIDLIFEQLGLDEKIQEQVIRMNDEEFCDFDEIVDFLKGKGL